MKTIHTKQCGRKKFKLKLKAEVGEAKGVDFTPPGRYHTPYSLPTLLYVFSLQDSLDKIKCPRGKLTRVFYCLENRVYVLGFFIYLKSSLLEFVILCTFF